MGKTDRDELPSGSGKGEKMAKKGEKTVIVTTTDRLYAISLGCKGKDPHIIWDKELPCQCLSMKLVKYDGRLILVGGEEIHPGDRFEAKVVNIFTGEEMPTTYFLPTIELSKRIFELKFEEGQLGFVESQSIEPLAYPKAHSFVKIIEEKMYVFHNNDTLVTASVDMKDVEIFEVFDGKNWQSLPKPYAPKVYHSDDEIDLSVDSSVRDCEGVYFVRDFISFRDKWFFKIENPYDDGQCYVFNFRNHQWSDDVDGYSDIKHLLHQSYPIKGDWVPVSGLDDQRFTVILTIQRDHPCYMDDDWDEDLVPNFCAYLFDNRDLKLLRYQVINDDQIFRSFFPKDPMVAIGHVSYSWFVDGNEIIAVCTGREYKLGSRPTSEVCLGISIFSLAAQGGGDLSVDNENNFLHPIFKESSKIYLPQPCSTPHIHSATVTYL